MNHQQPVSAAGTVTPGGVLLTELARLRQRFIGFAQEYMDADTEGRPNLELKKRHSLLVLHNAKVIATDAAPSPRLGWLAQVAALFHDIGRFPQYARYRTFRDDASVNHGHLGSQTLRKLGFLAGMPPADQRVVLGAVHCHNRRALPKRLTPDVDFVTRVVRDADKLDVLRVFRDHFANPNGKDPAVTLHVAHHPLNITPSVLQTTMEGRLPDYRDLRWTNDVLLLSLSWAYDLNFRASRKMLLDSGMIDEFLALLPADKRIVACGKKVREHLARG